MGNKLSVVFFVGGFSRLDNRHVFLSLCEEYNFEYRTEILLQFVKCLVELFVSDLCLDFSQCSKFVRRRAELVK